VIESGEMEIDYDPPEIEWIAGRAAPKVSPNRKHGKLQFRIGALLERLGGAFGEVASEWRIHLPADLAHGSLLVLEFDPDKHCVIAHANDGVATFGERKTFEHPAVPWLRFEIAPLFAGLEFPRDVR
jgi:hypothetical protein